MKHIIYITLLLFTLGSSIWGQSVYFDPSQIGANAHTISIGNIGGFNEDASAIFDNPASLYHTREKSLSAFTTKLMDEVQYINFAGSYRTRIGVVSLGYVSLGVNDIYATEKIPELTFPSDLDDYVLETFNYSNTLLKLGFQKTLNPNFHWGVALSLFKSEIYKVSGDGYNLDIGLTYIKVPFTFAYVIKNFLSDSNVDFSNNEQELLPTLQSLAIKMQYRSDTDLYFQIQDNRNPGDQNYLFSGGIVYNPKFFRNVRFSGGYKQLPVLRSTTAWTSFGVGYEISGLGFDYAYDFSNDSRYKRHYFSAHVNF